MVAHVILCATNKPYIQTIIAYFGNVIVNANSTLTNRKISTYCVYLPPNIWKEVVIAITTVLNSLRTQQPKREVRATRTSKQAPSPMSSVTAFHVAEYISPNIRYDEQSTDILLDSFRHTLNDETES